MSRIVVVAGNPRPASRTLALGVAVGRVLAEGAPEGRGQEATPGQPHPIDLGAFGARLLVPDAPEVVAALAAAHSAGTLVVATPTYKGSYTGVLKVFLDYLPANGLAGVAAVPVTVAGVEPQAEQSARHLSGLLTELGADVRTPIAVTESRLSDPARAALEALHAPHAP
ncbi:NADPH-dependent FMN reductase [Rhizomonospora bruguierae]|uniref:NADPH-dependent FMN reductase n=1 Tax=Rhizomonospora bruguierae TaxID=1581705 RepID=UPI001BCF295C|nr:NAD(P)H-dependent oxidoreductase [Micromonospora sp. NBRC 107566]